MSLRSRLVFALLLTALLPMGVAVGVAMLHASSRADQEAHERLEGARRRAVILVERHRAETAARVEKAAADLARDDAAVASLLRPESRPASSAVARALAARYGLDNLEILSSEGIVLSSSRFDASLGLKSPLASLPEEGASLRSDPFGRSTDGSPVAFVARRRVSATRAALSLAGGRAIGSEIVSLIAAVCGEPVDLLDRSRLPDDAAAKGPGHRTTESRPGERPLEAARDGVRSAPLGYSSTPSTSSSDSGAEAAPSVLASDSLSAHAADATPGGEETGAAEDQADADSSTEPDAAPAILSAGGPVPEGDRLASEIPLGGGGWAIRVSVPAGDVRQARRDLLAVFASIAPFAIASALALGVLLAQGVSRPIRALAVRAETITRDRAGPLTLPLVHEQDEAKRLTVCFERMLDALSDSERQRLGAERIAAWQEVAQRIAHEVKNPLSPIRLAVENLRRMRATGAGDFDRAFEEETATILEEVESLRLLVDEFSQFVRLPRPRLAPCDLREIVAQTRSLFTPRLEVAGVRVRIDDADAPGPVLADAEQIGRVLKNVVSNALDALEPVADRRLSITLSRGEGPRGEIATIEVRDSGVGLAPEALRRIFEPYFTTRSDRGGTGLGMAIAYRIVTDHGGTIRADGAPGRGASITIRLPVDGPAAGPP